MVVGQFEIQVNNNEHERISRWWRKGVEWCFISNAFFAPPAGTCFFFLPLKLTHYLIYLYLTQVASYEAMAAPAACCAESLRLSASSLLLVLARLSLAQG